MFEGEIINWFSDLLHQLRPQFLLRDLLDRVLNSELESDVLEKYNSSNSAAVALPESPRHSPPSIL